jgi:hypothetical protein
LLPSPVDLPDVEPPELVELPEPAESLERLDSPDPDEPESEVEELDDDELSPDELSLDAEPDPSEDVVASSLALDPFEALLFDERLSVL